nr:hypothetical protein [Hymenobacter sp. CCM 8763]
MNRKPRRHNADGASCFQFHYGVFAHLAAGARAERAGAELRIEPGFAQVIEHLGGGFEALLNVLE